MIDKYQLSCPLNWYPIFIMCIYFKIKLMYATIQIQEKPTYAGLL